VGCVDKSKTTQQSKKLSHLFDEAKKIISPTILGDTKLIIKNIIQINQKAKIKQPTTVHQRVFTSVKFFVCAQIVVLYT